MMKKLFKKLFKNIFKKFRKTLILVFVLVFLYFLFFRTITINPDTERNNMILLEEIKKEFLLSDFVSDGCSGNISNMWEFSVEELSKRFPDIALRYKDAQSIPFEYVCEEHDRLYHNAEGGYEGRLAADEMLRDGIIEYAIENVDKIKQLVGLETDESVIFLHEVIAEVIYRGVRFGGAPCTGMPYAWGYGYNGGVCEVEIEN
ncbi:MAG: hypothetical protein KAI16_02455 [Candidatus Pacebacteria bacterium]|nr:hypothetical protein [Candidatus Paceibacterota bacterium]